MFSLFNLKLLGTIQYYSISISKMSQLFWNISYLILYQTLYFFPWITLRSGYSYGLEAIGAIWNGSWEEWASTYMASAPG